MPKSRKRKKAVEKQRSRARATQEASRLEPGYLAFDDEGPSLDVAPDDERALDIAAELLDYDPYDLEALLLQRAALALAPDRAPSREPFYRLRDALDAFAALPEHQPFVTEGLQTWTDAIGEPPQGDENTLFYEWMLSTVSLDDDDAAPTLLDLFIKTAPPDLLEVALAWREDSHYGLWEVRPDNGPLVELVDLVSGITLFALAPPEQRDALLPRQVLLGPLILFQDFWHTGGAFMTLIPREGEELARDIYDIAKKLFAVGLGERLPFDDLDDYIGGLPRTVGADVEGPMPLEVMAFLASVVGGSLPTIVGALKEMRDEPSRFVTSDREQVIQIEARVRVPDTRTLTSRLLELPDYEAGERGEIVWFGKQLTALERETSLAQTRSQSVDVIEDEEQRWIRGVVEIDGDTEMSVRTNSRERFEGLLHAFRTHSDGVEVVEQTSFDPSLDLPPISPAAGGNLSAEAMKAWEKQWLDSGVPALGGATPRIAARRMPLAGHLEALLRGFEFQAALAQRSGGVGPRVDRLRKDLKLPAETWIRPRPW